MRVLYLDCGMGAAGDMLTAALLALLDKDEHDQFLRDINAALGGKAVVTAEPAVKCGVQGLHVHVVINGEEEGHEHRHHDGEHHHHHTGIKEIRELIESLPLSDAVREDALQIFNSIARAESEVHGTDMEHIHFHEVGSIDAVADVLGVCLLMEKLAPELVVALRGIPWYEGEIKSELCTPTGAALLRWFVNSWQTAPVLRVETCGYGMGTKDFGQLNAVRALLGDMEDEEDLYVLACNLDDMTGEELGFAQERLFEAGALDVWTAPIGMKKGRPGVLLSVLCRPERTHELTACLFKHTTTLGVREDYVRRYTLRRDMRTADTPWGPVSVKTASGYGVTREKPEYEDLAKIARENNLSLREVKEKIK